MHEKSTDTIDPCETFGKTRRLGLPGRITKVPFHGALGEDLVASSSVFVVLSMISGDCWSRNIMSAFLRTRRLLACFGSM